LELKKFEWSNTCREFIYYRSRLDNGAAGQ
jgi:hypothetical protein